MGRWDWCFGCGDKNPIGLHLNFEEKDGIMCADFVPSKEYQSYDGIVHGGIVATLLDEAMGKQLSDRGKVALTATLNVRFKRPIRVGSKVRICSWIEKENGRKVWLRARIDDGDGNILAEGQSLYIIVKHS